MTVDDISLLRSENGQCLPPTAYHRFRVNSTYHHFRHGSYYPRKSEFATVLIFKNNSGCLKKCGGGSSLPRI